jgi:hypothetical protein
MFPLALMFIISIFVFLETAATPSGSSEDYSDSSGIVIGGESNTTSNGTVEIPRAGSQNFNIWGTAGILVIVTAAVAIGIIAGIKVLGSGLDDLSHSLIFNSILFLGLWACLTIVSRDLMFVNIIMQILWLSMTMVYMLGFATHINGAES